MSSLVESLDQLMDAKGVSKETLLEIVQDILLMAYQKKYGTIDNAVIKVFENEGLVKIFMRKRVVEKVVNPFFEMSLYKAKEINPEAQVGDDIDIEVDPQSLGRLAINKARQVAMNRLKDLEREKIYYHFLKKKGTLLVGVIQRVKDGDYYINLGEIEAVLQRRELIGQEFYEVGQSVRFILKDIFVKRYHIQVILSRKDPLFVQRLFESEIPEIQSNKIQINSLARLSGYKTKIALSSSEGIDPVGTCIGMKGIRISVILKELKGEKIDLIRYSDDIETYVRNAFNHFNVIKVIILDYEQRKLLVILDEKDLSLAIGKQGSNIKLLAALLGWELDVKSEEAAKDLILKDQYEKISQKIFMDDFVGEHSIDQLDDLRKETIDKLKDVGFYSLEALVQLSKEDLLSLEKFSEEEINQIIESVEKNVTIVEEEDDDDGSVENQEDNNDVEEDSVENQEELNDEGSDLNENDLKDKLPEDSLSFSEEDSEEEEDFENYEYYCPECNHQIQYGDKNCSSCNIEISFE